MPHCHRFKIVADGETSAFRCASWAPFVLEAYELDLLFFFGFVSSFCNCSYNLWLNFERVNSLRVRLRRGQHLSFSWCGHIAKITTRDPTRETSKLFLHKNTAWLRSLKKELGTQCHGRRFRVWRWEQAVAQWLEDEWVSTGQNSTVWRSKLEEMINWKNQKNKSLLMEVSSYLVWWRQF